MCRRFDRNRAKLTKLIYGKREAFNKNVLISEFSQNQRGNIIIDGSQTIAQYLDELVEYGALTCQRGIYRVKH